MVGMGAPQAAKRAFVRVIVYLASVYGISANVNRDSPDADLMKAYRKVALRCHPDKGGSTAHIKQLNTARDSWKESQQPHAAEHGFFEGASAQGGKIRSLHETYRGVPICFTITTHN